MVKIFFLEPSGEWSIDVGNATRWKSFFHNVRRHGDLYTIVDDESLADFIINLECDYSSNNNIASRLKPLTHSDVKTIVWDSFDNPTGHASGFYCSLPKMLFDHRRHSALSYPGPYYETIENFPLEDAYLNFSFLGRMTAGVRVRILEQFRNREKEVNAIVRISGDIDWDGAVVEPFETEADRWYAEFLNLLRRSKFVLCPRGYGTGSFRLFETMQAGRVPIIISDDYVYPEGIDWSSCSLTVAESRIADIPEIIRSRLNDWEMLASNARSVWEENFSPQNIMNGVAKSLLRISQNIEKDSFSSFAHLARVSAVTLHDNFRPVLGSIKRNIMNLGSK